MKNEHTEPKSLTALKRAIEICHGQTAFARRINEWRKMHQPEEKKKDIKQGHVWKWLHVTQKIQVDCVLAAEGALNGEVSRYEFREDIYGTKPAKFRRRHDDQPVSDIDEKSTEEK